MPYGRIMLALIAAQAVILSALLVAPFQLNDASRATVILLLSGAIAIGAACLLYVRQRSRDRREFARKLQHLRQSAAG